MKSYHTLEGSKMDMEFFSKTDVDEHSPADKMKTTVEYQEDEDNVLMESKRVPSSRSGKSSTVKGSPPVI